MLRKVPIEAIVIIGLVQLIVIFIVVILCQVIIVPKENLNI
jgi:hypothetical protein